VSVNEGVSPNPGRERRRKAASRSSCLFVTAAVVAACGGGVRSTDKSAAVAPVDVSEKCPDFARPDEVAAFDFGREYALSAEGAEKLKVATLTAIDLGILADKLDAELGIACAQLARDLGNKGDWHSGAEACAAASKGIGELRGRIGAKAQTRLTVRTPVCLTDPSFVTKCASLCDSAVPAGKAHAECEQQAGRCEGNCDGVCEPKNSPKCAGVCTGTCDAAMRGTCGGRCKGTCDGRPVNGGCLGVCAGTCDRGPISGECKGACAGTCKLTAPGICDGVCAGTCTVELSEPRCSGPLKDPEISRDCLARCGLATVANTVCSLPHVGFVATAPKEREAGDQMKTAIDRSLPSLLKMLAEVGEKGPQRVLDAQTVVDNARKSFKDLAASRSKATATTSEKQLVKCFDEPFKRASASATSVKTGLEQAENVRSEASK
jgi:hypothetical protein